MLTRSSAVKVKRLSAVWVIHVQDDNLADVLAAYLQALTALDCECDLTIVCNGSAIDAAEVFKDQLVDSSISVDLLTLHKQFEDAIAMSAGIDATSGDVIVILPAYLQSDPTAIHAMVEAIENGSDYVQSWRRKRVDSKWDSVKSRAFNRVTRWLTGMSLHDLNSGLRMFRREVTATIPVYGDLHRFTPILADQRGFTVTEVETTHLTERVLPGDYRIGVYVRRALDLLTLFFVLKFTRKPLRFFGLLGTSMLAFAGIVMIAIFVQRIMGTSLSDRPMLVFAVLAIVLGIQLFSAGLLGELIIYSSGLRQTDYIVKRVEESEGRGQWRQGV